MNYRHGMRHTRLYNIWRHMKDRCYNKNYFQYYLYGGRGIKVCEEWQNDFMVFFNWAIKNGYNEKLTIDRINVDGDYEPSNCRWATKIEQANNKRNNINITYNGETHCIEEWAEITGIKYSTLYWRYKNWKDISEILERN